MKRLNSFILGVLIAVSSFNAYCATVNMVAGGFGYSSNGAISDAQNKIRTNCAVNLGGYISGFSVTSLTQTTPWTWSAVVVGRCVY